MTDIDGMYRHLRGELLKITKDPDRDVAMSNMIEMLTQIHVDSVTMLAGAVLITAKVAQDQGRDISPMLDVVRELIETQDSDFSMRLRSQIMTFIEDQQTPDPFSSQETQAHTQ